MYGVLVTGTWDLGNGKWRILGLIHEIMPYGIDITSTVSTYTNLHTAERRKGMKTSKKHETKPQETSHFDFVIFLFTLFIHCWLNFPSPRQNPERRATVTSYSISIPPRPSDGKKSRDVINAKIYFLITCIILPLPLLESYSRLIRGLSTHRTAPQTN